MATAPSGVRRCPGSTIIKIISKILLIVALLSMVTVGSIVFATSRLRAMDEANTDLVTRIDKSTTLAARAARRAENYMSSAFQLLAETTEAGNARLVAQAVASREAYVAGMATILKNMPEQASVIEPTVALFQTAFGVCRPIMLAAGKATAAAEKLIVAEQLRADCVPLITKAIDAQTRMGDGFLANAAKAAEQMSADANSTIRTVWIASILGLLLGLAAALWIGIVGISQSVGRLKAMMQKLAANDLTIPISGLERRDELGDMARTVEVFKNNALEAQQMRSRPIGRRQAQCRAAQGRDAEARQ